MGYWSEDDDRAEVMLDLRDEILAVEDNWRRYDDCDSQFRMADVTDVGEACQALLSSCEGDVVGVDGRIFDPEERGQIARFLNAYGVTLVQVQARCHCDRVEHFERIPTLMGVRR